MGARHREQERWQLRGRAGASVGRHIRPDAHRAGPFWPGGGRGYFSTAGWLGRDAWQPRAQRERLHARLQRDREE